MLRRWSVRFAIALTTVMVSTGADASMPIPFAYIGCIEHGKLTSKGQLVDMLWRSPMSVEKFEGRTVRLESFLSPAQFTAFTVDVLAETCQPALHKAEALCNPCVTVPPDLPIPQAAPAKP